MFAHTTRIASVSTLSFALVASSFSVAHATPTAYNAPVSYTQISSPSIEEMERDQKPAPVRGEDEQVISIEGIDADALPQDKNLSTEEQPSETSEGSEPSDDPEAVSPTQDYDDAPGKQESIEAEPHSEETLDDPTSTEEPAPESAETSPETPSATTTPTQSPRTAEEEQLAETAIEDSEGTLAALTTPVESIDFLAAGITWESNTSEDITEAALRVREQGEWSEWHALEVHATDEEMKAQSPRAGTEPLITLEADAVQARVYTRSGVAPEGLEVALIDPGESPTDGQLEPASEESDEVETVSEASATSGARHLDGATGESSQPGSEQMMRSVSARTPLQTNRTNRNANVIKPAIVTRAQWGADESITSTSPQSRELKAMYVHHTAGVNNYSRANAYAQVRAVHRYHAGTLGWPDIGYHFLVDRYGTIYEGRRGSLDSLPLGAQAGGFNTNTIGISAIGNFDKATPPAAMVESLKKVLAWKGLQYGINATGTTTLTAGRGNSSKYSQGTRVSVNTILGHRDTNATVCPGRYLYSQLPSIRRDVATRINNAKASTSYPTRTISSGLTYRADRNTVMRSQPSSTSAVRQGIRRGDQVTTTNVASGNWWRVTHNGKTGWISYKHFSRSSQSTAPTNYKYRTIASGLTYRAQRNTVMRSEPSSTSAVVQGVRRGDRVTTTNRASGNWWRVTHNGKTGWISYKHFTRSR